MSGASPVMAPAPSLIVMYAPATNMRGPITIPLAIASRSATSLNAAIDADVAHSREPSQQCNACVGDNRIGAFGRRFLQHQERLGITHVSQVRVAINESGSTVIFERSDHRRAGGTDKFSPIASSFPATHTEHLIRQNATRVYIDKFSGTYHSNLHRRSSLLGWGKRYGSEQQQNNTWESP